MLWSISQIFRSSIHDELLDHLKQDKAVGRSLSAEPELLTEFLIGAIEEVLRWWFASKEPISMDEMKKQLLDSMLRLVSTETGSSSPEIRKTTGGERVRSLYYKAETE